MLAGNYDVLSTKIFFAVAGAQHDPGRAAVLASVLLALTLVAFWLQQRWLGRASYVTVSGKGDGGMPAQLPRGLWLGCFWFAAAWIVFTLVCYVVILTGGFVKDIGRGDMTLDAPPLRRRLRHRLGTARPAVDAARRGTACSTPCRSPRSPRR